MNIGEAFLRNLILTVFSCILPILVGAVYLPAAKKNPKEKRIAPIIALIPESISPFIMAAMANFLFNSSSRGTRRFFWHYPLLRQILFILSFSICFIAYIPKQELFGKKRPHRQFVGLVLDRFYVEFANNRIRQARRQPSLQTRYEHSSNNCDAGDFLSVRSDPERR